MNNQQAIDRLVKHLEWGWTKETVEAIKWGYMHWKKLSGFHAMRRCRRIIRM